MVRLGLNPGQPGLEYTPLTPPLNLLPSTTCHSFKSSPIKIVWSTKATQLNETWLLASRNPRANRGNGISESEATEESAGRHEGNTESRGTQAARKRAAKDKQALSEQKLSPLSPSPKPFCVCPPQREAHHWSYSQIWMKSSLISQEFAVLWGQRHEVK